MCRCVYTYNPNLDAFQNPKLDAWHCLLTGSRIFPVLLWFLLLYYRWIILWSFRMDHRVFFLLRLADENLKQIENPNHRAVVWDTIMRVRTKRDRDRIRILLRTTLDGWMQVHAIITIARFGQYFVNYSENTYINSLKNGCFRLSPSREPRNQRPLPL